VNTEQIIHGIEGKSVYEITRTEDFAFLLRIGNATRQHSNGSGQFLQEEWELTVYACAWRILQKEVLVVGSYDKEEFIDAVLPSSNLGVVRTIEIITVANDLRIIFSSGMRLETFTSSALLEEHDLQWRLANASGTRWIQNKGGKLYLSSDA
jgi:hypothetical protein